jgi:hypothetical protein
MAQIIAGVSRTFVTSDTDVRPDDSLSHLVAVMRRTGHSTAAAIRRGEQFTGGSPSGGKTASDSTQPPFATRPRRKAEMRKKMPPGMA